MHSISMSSIKFCWFCGMQVVYDICTRIVKLNSKQNGPIRLKNEGDDHRENGTNEILDWNTHDSSQLQQRIEALQVS